MADTAGVLEVERCATCGAELPVNHGYVTWCTACGWNLTGDGSNPAPPTDVDAATARRELTVAELIAAGDLRPRRDPARLRTLAIALGVHLASLALLGVGVALAVWAWPHGYPGLIVAAIIIWQALAMRPRLPRLGRRTKPLGRAQLPTTFALLDEVAGAIGANIPAGVVLDGSWNARFGQFGLTRRGILVIGLPLWWGLEHGPRLALLGHELGHAINGDGGHRVIVVSARHAADEWIDLARIRPMHVADARIRGGAALARGALAPIGWLGQWVRGGLDRSTARSHQRAEFYADQLAAEVASSRATEDLLETLLVGPGVTWAFERASRHPDGRSMREVEIDYLTALPDRERERLRRAATFGYHRADASHPPTADRLAVVAGRGGLAGKISAGRVDWARIDAELAAACPQIDQLIRRRVTRGT